MKHITGKASVALAAVISLIGLAAYGFTRNSEANYNAFLMNASAEEVVQELGANRYRDPMNASWKFVDYTSDSDVTNDNDTDSGQSPLPYPNWTYTVTGTTAPTVATHGVGGLLTVTNASSDNDRIEADETAEWVKLTAGKTYYMVFRGKYDCTTANQADFGFGIGIQDTDWLGDTAIMSDGIFFEVNDGDANLDVVSAWNAASTSDYVRSAAVSTVTDNTYFKLEMWIIMDATTAEKGRVIARKNGVVVYDATRTALPDDEELCIKWGLQNGAAEAQALTIDYFGVGADR